MKIAELRQKSVDALKRDVAHAREELRDLRFQISQNQQKDVRKFREQKRVIAQMLTLMKEKSQNKKPKTK
ncbi:MAG: 50S ribosomal protein L29 [Patescibacteria group bacterium]|jgi:ribosomal protein L29